MRQCVHQLLLLLIRIELVHVINHWTIVHVNDNFFETQSMIHDLYVFPPDTLIPVVTQFSHADYSFHSL